MAVRKKVVAIVVWSLCGAFLVAVTVLAVLLWCRRLRQRRHRLQLQSQQQQHAHYDHTSLYIKDDVDVVDVESSRRNTNAEAAARVGARDTHEQARYHGYTRGRVVELQTLPPAGAHTTPLLVHILACAAAAATAADDNVARRGAHTHATATIDADAATSVTATQALRGVGDYHSTISSGSGNSTRTAAAAAAASAAASLSRCDILVRVRAASACAGDALDPVAVVNRQLHCRHDDGGDGDTYGDTSMYADAAAVVVAPDTITTNTQQQQSQQQQSQQASPSPHVLLLSPTACEQCYGDDHFLRYTSPLFFAAAGVYVVDAYTVRPYAQRVSVVHRFLFAVRTPPPPPRDARVRVHSDVTRAHVVPAHTQHSHRPTRAKEVEVTLDGQWLTAPVQHTHRRHRHHDAAAAMGAVPPTQPTAASSASLPPPPPSSSTSSSSTSILTACVYAPHTGLPLPPHIVPERGDVTTATPIVITPHEQSTTPDQIRYSIDGSYPTLLYSGPFTLSVPSLASPATAPSSSSSPPPPSTAMVTVRAVSVTAAMMPVAHTPTTTSSTRRSSRLPPMVPTPHATSATLLQQQQQQQQGLSSSSTQSPAPTTAAATCSAVSEAVLRVRYAGYSYYDARLPAPSLRLHAVGAQLYFDERATPAGACTVYQLLSVHAARTRVQFDRRRCSVYTGVPITIAHDVAMVCAWTVDAAMLHGEAGEQKQQQQQRRREEEQGRSRAQGSAATRAGLVLSEVDSDVESRDSYVVTTSTNTVAAATRQHGALPPRRQHRRSCAVVYDCNRAAIRHTTPSARRLAQQHDQQRQEHATTTTTASTLSSSSSSSAPSPPPLPAPVPCIACKEVSVAFDDVPASAMIVYTLNESEPALYDVVPPACAVPLTSASRHTKERQQQHYHDVHGRSSSRHTDNNDKTSGSNNNNDDDDDDDDELVRGDEGGLHTFRYVPGTHIPLTLLATRPVCVTARVFMPLYRDSESAAVVHGTVSTVTAGGAAGGAAAAGGGVTAAAAGGGGGGRVLLGYRYGDVFRRTFYFAGDGGSSSSGSGMNSTSNLVAAAGDGGGQC